jgi:hypothetical protein
MRLFDAKSQHWTKRHIYVFMAAAGFAIIAIGYPVVGFLEERNQDLADECGFDCPNFMYYHNGGDGLLVFFLSLAIGGGLLILSPIVAIGYFLIRRGVKFEDLKVKGSNVD